MAKGVAVAVAGVMVVVTMEAVVTVGAHVVVEETEVEATVEAAREAGTTVSVARAVAAREAARAAAVAPLLSRPPVLIHSSTRRLGDSFPAY